MLALTILHKDGVIGKFSVSPMVPSLPSSTPLPSPQRKADRAVSIEPSNTKKQEGCP